jgi:hypothetical protein
MRTHVVAVMGAGEDIFSLIQTHILSQLSTSVSWQINFQVSMVSWFLETWIGEL